MQERNANWIWTAEWTAEDKEEPSLVLFLKKFELAALPESAWIQISADTRYKLYANGRLVEIGPSRGDRQIWFYDELDLKPYLAKGKNALAVQVLRYPTEHRKGNHGMFRTEYPGLYAKGCVTDAKGKGYVLDADESWKCRKAKGFHIVPEAEGFAPLQIYEECQGEEELNGWMLPAYDDGAWLSAKPYPFMSQAVSPGNLYPRTIPFLYRKRHDFQEVSVIRQSVFEKSRWEELLHAHKELTIPAHAKEVLDISAGEEMTAYLNLALQGGAGATITLLQSEGYVQEGYHKELPIKGHRMDWEHGHLDGFADRYHVAGYGSREMPEEYEPFWFRTFRYIRLEIETKEEPLTLLRLDYTETGYPLEVRTCVAASDKRLAAVWEISERTLRRCMHETYEDCPFYEQLQYVMDARAEILYTYAIAADDRLARKCMDDFKRSQRYDGLLNASYPCYGPNVIPGFSIYYILMLYDHMMYFGDKELLEEHLPTVFGILNYFHHHLTKEGYVEKLGGLNGKEANWSFIDWTPEWDDTTGVPKATLRGPITMESLLYVMGLQHTALILEYLAQEELAAWYLERAAEVQHAIRWHCTGKDGMLQDGPGVEQYSQHVQVFAILTKTLEMKQAKKNLEATLLYPEEYAQCSVAMAFYLFRALQMADMYVWTQEYWDIWLRMLQKGATTCVEDEVGERSDCHAWGSLILYELPCVVLGVQPAKPGCKAIKISPEPGYLEHASGSVLTPKGTVRVRWSVEDGGTLAYDASEGVEIIVDTSSLKEIARYYT